LAAPPDDGRGHADVWADVITDPEKVGDALLGLQTASEGEA
jgi:hypothetical protein